MASFFGKKEGEEKEVDPGKAVEARFTSLEESNKKLSETLGTVAETIAAMNKRETEKQAQLDKQAKDRAEAEAKRKAEEGAPKTPEEVFERFAEDPNNYIRQATEPATRLAILTAAKLTRQETLGDQEYYYGEFKAKVDALIDAEPNIGSRANPAFIMNCYKIIKSDYTDQIIKGDLKKKASMSGFSDGGHSGNKEDKDSKPTIEYKDNKSRYAASQLGIKDEDLVEAAKSGNIHGLEVVV